MDTKIFAGIVTFNPEIRRLEDNILAIKGQVESIIVVDNNSDNLKDFEKIIGKYKFCRLIKNVHNYGIAYALNQIMEVSCINGIKWVLLLDQDSICPKNLITEFKKFLDYPNVAVITPVIKDINSSYTESTKEYIEKITRFITSGSLNSVEIWEKLGKFDETFFIDMVDYEYAFRLQRNGYKILRINSVQLLHEIGKMTHKKIGPFEISTYNHNAFRKYYITRNSLLLAEKYPEYYSKVLIRLKIIKRGLIVLFCENNKIEKLNAMLKGYKDYKLMNKGKK